MAISVEDIVEAIIDELVVGEFVGDAEVTVQRTAPGTLSLDYGDAGRFVLNVSPG